MTYTFSRYRGAASIYVCLAFVGYTKIRRWRGLQHAWLGELIEFHAIEIGIYTLSSFISISMSVCERGLHLSELLLSLWP